MRQRSFDGALEHARVEDLKSMARLYGGKLTRKDECIAFIRSALADPEQVGAMLDRVAPFERAALGVLKQFGGAMSADGLAVAIRTLGVPLPSSKFHQRDHFLSLDPLTRHGLIQYDSRDYLAFSYSDYAPQTMISDARILAHVGPPQVNAFKIKRITPEPSSTHMRRPQSFALHILSILNTIVQMGSLHLNKTRARDIRAADLNKLATTLRWSDRFEIDGLPFPDPTNAFVGALVAAELLVVQDDALVLAISPEQFAEQTYAQQVGKLLPGFVNNQRWQEYWTQDYFGRPNADRLAGGRIGLLTALMALPQDSSAFYSLSDLEQAWFDRVGEDFSLSHVASPPSTYSRTPAQQESDLQKWRQALRKDWLKREVPWMQKALSTWVYGLGLVELGLEEGTITSLRLSELGREILWPLADAQMQSAAKPTRHADTVEEAWIIQPNFDIVAYLDRIAPKQLAFLERHAERLSSQQHTAQYRLTHDSVYRGLESGTTIEALLEALQASAKAALPQNVVVELKSWAGLREQIWLRRAVRLIEYPSAHRRDEAIAHGTAIGERYLLLPHDATSRPRTTRQVDYSLPPSKCLSITEAGEITLRETDADLLIAAQLNGWAEPTAENKWRLTSASVSMAVKRSIGISDLFALLESRLARPLPPFLKMALRNWAGTKRLTKASVSAVTILRCYDSEAFTTILASQQLKHYLRGQLGPDAVLVDSSKVEMMKQILSWAGVQETVEMEELGE